MTFCAVNPRAFTLPELLVAIGIISLLIGVVVPVTVRVRSSSQQAVCTSNLRQWTLAVTMYASSNDGFLPRRGQGVQATNQIDRPSDWFNALPPLLNSQTYSQLAAAGKIPRPGGQSSIWICPAAVDIAGTYYWTYAMNMGLSVTEANQNNGHPDRISGVGDTSTLVFMADAPWNYAAVWPSQTAGGYNPVARHGRQANLAFLDGHVAGYRAEEIGIGTGLITRPDVRWHSPSNTWNSAK